MNLNVKNYATGLYNIKPSFDEPEHKGTNIHHHTYVAKAQNSTLQPLKSNQGKF